MATSKYFKWIKPLKRSEKVRLRKELKKRKREESIYLKGHKWELNKWELSWKQIKEMF